jgi:hypothetical protein
MTAHDSLNGGQFHHTPQGKGGDWYEYTKPDPIGKRHVHLTLATNQMPDRTVYATPSDNATISSSEWEHLTGTRHRTQDRVPGRQGEDVDYHGATSSGGDHLLAAKRDLETPGPGGQGKLFGMSTKPGRSTVSVLMGTREGRVHAPTALGIAQMQNIQDFGRTLLPSGDLSPHSAKLAKNLHQRGATSEAPAPASNHMDFGIALSYSGKNNDVVPQQAVRAGRNLTRRVARGGNADPRGVSDADGPSKEPIPNYNRKSPPRRGTATRKPDPRQGTLF